MAELDFPDINKLNERYNRDPKSKIFVQLADAYRKKDMVEEALDVLSKGLQHHSQYPIAYLIQGKCYFDKKMFIRAKESFEKVLSLDSQNIVALRMLARTCEFLKDETGQLAAYKGILAVDPLDTAAQEKIEKLETMQKKAPIYTITTAQEYEKQGNLSEALAIYEYLLTTDPTDLVLQEKVKELTQTVGKEAEKPAAEEKVEGLQVGTYYSTKDISKKEEIIPTGAKFEPESAGAGEDKVEQTQPPVVEQTTPPPPEQNTAEPVKPVGTETEEKVMDLGDFLTEEPIEKSVEETKQPEVVQAAESKEPSKIEELFFEAESEKTEVKEVTADAQPQAETPTEKQTPFVEKEPRASTQPETEAVKPPEVPTQLKVDTPKTEPQKPEPEKKPKEEDFQSFQEWLSGLLK